MKNICWLIPLFAATSALLGCSGPKYTTLERYDKGLVLCLGGAGGNQWQANRIRQGLGESGITCAVEVYQWSRCNLLEDLTDLRRNRSRASQLARHIELYRDHYPGRPVWVIGVSGGTAISTWGVEQISPDHSVTGLILISSTLHHTYDLTKALEKTNGGIYSFHSSHDAVLSLAMPVFRTADRQGTQAAGVSGFTLPLDVDGHARQLYQQKLIQRSWQLDDIWQGNLGGHHGTSNPAFVRRYIAPLISG